jgi:hypothetical protein
MCSIKLSFSTIKYHSVFMIVCIHVKKLKILKHKISFSIHDNLRPWTQNRITRIMLTFDSLVPPIYVGKLSTRHRYFLASAETYRSIVSLSGTIIIPWHIWQNTPPG